MARQNPPAAEAHNKHVALARNFEAALRRHQELTSSSSRSAPDVISGSGGHAAVLEVGAERASSRA
jgi:hypothetical protein